MNRVHQLFSIVKEGNGKSFLQNALFLWGANILPMLAGFLFWGLASRLYTPTEIGLVSAMISACALVAGLAGPGFNLGVVRFLPEAQNPVQFLNAVYTAIILSSLLAGGIYLGGLHWWSPGLKILVETPWYTAGFIVFVIAINLGATVRETFVARRQSKYSLWYTAIANLSRLALVIPLAWIGLAGLSIAVLAGYSLALWISWMYMLPLAETGYHFTPTWNWSAVKPILTFSFGNYLVNLIGQLPQTILPLMILETLGAQANGTAYIALMLGSLILSPGLALSMSSFAEGANQSETSSNLLSHAARIALLITILVAGITFLAASPLLSLFGPDYARSSTALLRWLSLAAIPAVLNQMYFSWLRIKKQTRPLILLSGYITIITIGCTYLWLPSLSIAACGLATLTANILALPFHMKKSTPA